MENEEKIHYLNIKKKMTTTTMVTQPILSNLEKITSTPGPSGEEIPMTTMNREKEKSSFQSLKHLSLREIFQE